MNIYLDLNYRQKQNGGYELQKVFAEKILRKERRRVCFIRGEEIQYVGRTIFIEKNASLCLSINNFNPDFIQTKPVVDSDFDFLLHHQYQGILVSLGQGHLHPIYYKLYHLHY